MPDDPEAADTTGEPAEDDAPASAAPWAPPDPARSKPRSPDHARPEPAPPDTGGPEPAPPPPATGGRGAPGEDGALGDAPPRRRGRRRSVVLAIAGAIGLIAGVTCLVLEFDRAPTGAERTASVSKELAARWRIRTAGEIFVHR
ncbi:hypothetical protein NE235_21530 [Actinoallomurus spadix]|uniref:hypothetical protein n=1 Tax=Actinoallomurus spadix TaxID=79912 RepID=UPI0020935898|nr:hypothetical protein [Actinoallomurus spadix]MCO5988692.1 hypothetical protein [Actinoallomurus spadix]